MKRWIHAASRRTEMDLEGVVSWNGYFYGFKPGKHQKYYKSKTVRFDDTFGGTEEISSEEYDEVAQKYARVMKDNYY